jgi:hypothetical protein
MSGMGHYTENPVQGVNACCRYLSNFPQRALQSRDNRLDNGR